MTKAEMQRLIGIITPEAELARATAFDMAISVSTGDLPDNRFLAERRNLMMAAVHSMEVKLLEQGVGEAVIAYIKGALCETFENNCKNITLKMTEDQQHRFHETMQVAFGLDIGTEPDGPEALCWRERISKLIPKTPGGHQR